MRQFIYEAQPGRVVFGLGTVKETAKELDILGVQKALIISTPGNSAVLAEKVAAMLGEQCAGVYTKAIQHVPVESVQDALNDVDECKADGLVAVGGGSPIGLAKAIALERPTPIVAIPTTYSGSEMTHIWGMTKDGVKITGPDPRVKPRSVIYDPELTVGLPARFSLLSGINAMAHSVEALYAEHANPISSFMAEEGIRALAAGLPKIIASPSDMQARSDALYGAWLSGSALASAGLGVHHKLCHTLGGSFNLSHADTHTVILPYAIAYNKNHAPEAMKTIARALGADVRDLAGFVYDFIKSLGGPVSLAEIGMKAEDLDRAAAIAMQRKYYNPRPIEITPIRNLLEYAYQGIRPDPNVKF